MRFWAAMLALAGVMLASPGAKAVTTYSSHSSSLQEVIATATVPDHGGAPLYFRVISGTLAGDKTSSIAPGDGVYYQLSGTVDIDIDGNVATLRAGNGVFIAAGTKFTLDRRDADRSASYLKFLLVPASGLRPPDKTRREHEIYRSPDPLLGVMPESNLLSLSRVEMPPQSPCDPLHQRSGAALHYVLSGAGAEFTENRAMAKGPGSISYEPNRLAYQWSNPGSTPLVYLLFNVNPKGEPAVTTAGKGAGDPFLSDVHVSVAIYSVALSMILIAVVASTIAIDSHDDKMHRGRPGKK